MNQSAKLVIIGKGERSTGARLIWQSYSKYDNSIRKNYSIGMFVVARSYKNFTRFHAAAFHPYYENILLTILVATELKTSS